MSMSIECSTSEFVDICGFNWSFQFLMAGTKTTEATASTCKQSWRMCSKSVPAPGPLLRAGLMVGWSPGVTGQQQDAEVMFFEIISLRDASYHLFWQDAVKKWLQNVSDKGFFQGVIFQCQFMIHDGSAISGSQVTSRIPSRAPSTGSNIVSPMWCSWPPPLVPSRPSWRMAEWWPGETTRMALTEPWLLIVESCDKLWVFWSHMGHGHLACQVWRYQLQRHIAWTSTIVNIVIAIFSSDFWCFSSSKPTWYKPFSLMLFKFNSKSLKTSSVGHLQPNIQLTGSLVSEQLRDVKQIYASARAFAAVRSDGSVVTWGDPENGGDSSAVANWFLFVFKDVFPWLFLVKRREDACQVTVHHFYMFLLCLFFFFWELMKPLFVRWKMFLLLRALYREARGPRALAEGGPYSFQLWRLCRHFVQSHGRHLGLWQWWRTSWGRRAVAECHLADLGFWIMLLLKKCYLSPYLVPDSQPNEKTFSPPESTYIFFPRHLRKMMNDVFFLSLFFNVVWHSVSGCGSLRSSVLSLLASIIDIGLSSAGAYLIIHPYDMFVSSPCHVHFKTSHESMSKF